MLRAGRRMGLGEGGGRTRRVMSSRLTAMFASTVVGPGVGLGGVVVTCCCVLHCGVVDGGMERVVVADEGAVVLVVCGMNLWHGCNG